MIDAVESLQALPERARGIDDAVHDRTSRDVGFAQAAVEIGQVPLALVQLREECFGAQGPLGYICPPCEIVQAALRTVTQPAHSPSQRHADHVSGAPAPHDNGEFDLLVGVHAVEDVVHVRYACESRRGEQRKGRGKCMHM